MLVLSSTSSFSISPWKKDGENVLQVFQTPSLRMYMLKKTDSINLTPPSFKCHKRPRPTTTSHHKIHSSYKPSSCNSTPPLLLSTAQTSSFIKPLSPSAFFPTPQWQLFILCKNWFLCVWEVGIDIPIILTNSLHYITVMIIITLFHYVSLFVCHLMGSEASTLTVSFPFKITPREKK